jgi:hypothetical protein
MKSMHIGGTGNFASGAFVDLSFGDFISLMKMPFTAF